MSYSLFLYAYKRKTLFSKLQKVIENIKYTFMLQPKDIQVQFWLLSLPVKCKTIIIFVKFKLYQISSF